MSEYDDVGAFNKKFGLPYYGDGSEPHFLDQETQMYRIRHMIEELQEYQDACGENDLAGAADALVDLVYVAMGTAHFMGIPFNECWDEVQRANMSKVRAESASDDRSKRKNAWDVVKPANFVPPDIWRIIHWATNNALRRRSSASSSAPDSSQSTTPPAK